VRVLENCPGCREPTDRELIQVIISDHHAIQVGNTPVMMYSKEAVGRCMACDLRFIAGRLPPEDLIAYYKDGDYTRRPGQPLDLDARAKKSGVFTRLVLQSLKNSDINPVRHLDFGCAQGNLMLAVDWKTVGVEIEPNYIKWARAHDLDVYEDLKDVPGFFDLITLIEVLEHLDQPLDSLIALNAKLTIGGHIMISVPDLLKRHPSPLSNRHLSAFTPTALQNIMDKAGFEKKLMYHVNFIIPTLFYVGVKK